MSNVIIPYHNLSTATIKCMSWGTIIKRHLSKVHVFNSMRATLSTEISFNNLCLRVRLRFTYRKDKLIEDGMCLHATLNWAVILRNVLEIRKCFNILHHYRYKNIKCFAKMLKSDIAAKCERGLYIEFCNTTNQV